MSSIPEQFNPSLEKPQVILDAERRAEELADPLVEQGMAAIERLASEIEAAQLASRFRRNATAEEIRERVLRPGELLSHLAQTKIDQEGEAGYKKAQLLGDLVQTQQALLGLAGRLKRIVVDFEMSKLDEQEQK